MGVAVRFWVFASLVAGIIGCSQTSTEREPAKKLTILSEHEVCAYLANAEQVSGNQPAERRSAIQGMCEKRLQQRAELTDDWQWQNDDEADGEEAAAPPDPDLAAFYRAGAGEKPVPKNVSKELGGQAAKTAISAAGQVNNQGSSAFRFLGSLVNGFGVGATIGAGTGFGTGVEVGFEVVYFNGPGTGKFGHFAGYCAPALNLMGSSASVTPVAGALAIKTLGCHKAPDYEGGFLTVSLWPGKGLNFSLGINLSKFAEFLDDLDDLDQIITQSQFETEMANLEASFVAPMAQQAMPAGSALSFYIFLWLFESAFKEVITKVVPAADQAAALDQINRWQKIVFDSIDFANLLKFEYPSLGSVWRVLLAEMPSGQFPISHRILTGISSAIGGCDSVSFAWSADISPVNYATTLKRLQRGGLTLAYAYYTNPPRQVPYQSDKMILPIEALLPSVDTVTGTAAGAVDVLFNPLGLSNSGSVLWGRFGDVLDGAGLTSISAVNFLTRAFQLSDPGFLAKNCAMPAADEVSDLGRRVGSWFE